VGKLVGNVGKVSGKVMIYTYWMSSKKIYTIFYAGFARRFTRCFTQVIHRASP